MPTHQHVQQALVPGLRPRRGAGCAAEAGSGTNDASCLLPSTGHSAALRHTCCRTYHMLNPTHHWPPTRLELSQPPAVLAQARRQRVQQAGGAVAQRTHQKGGVAQVRHVCGCGWGHNGGSFACQGGEGVCVCECDTRTQKGRDMFASMPSHLFRARPAGWRAGCRAPKSEGSEETWAASVAGVPSSAQCKLSSPAQCSCCQQSQS